MMAHFPVKSNIGFVSFDFFCIPATQRRQAATATEFL
jgi:hypothetical protein